MALANLSLVTRAIAELIARRVEVMSVWQPRSRPTVSPLPPDQVDGGGLSLHLYHVAESAQLRNQPPRDPAAGHVRHAPLALDLYYRLVPIPSGSTAVAALEAQLLFGCALKVLHDVPVIDDGTEAGDIEILPHLGLDAADNRFRIALQRMAPDEAAGHWTSESEPPRLASYLEVSVVLLEPEPPERRAGRVLRYDIATLIVGAPRIARTESRIVFLPPGAAEPREIVASPALVTYGGTVEMLGHGFEGEEVDLLLRRGGDAEPRVADPAWGVLAATDRVVATVRAEIDGRAVVPGLYAAAIRVGRRAGERMLRFVSNESPFQVAPEVRAVTEPDPGLFRLEGGIFADPDLPSDRLEVYLGAIRLTEVAGPPAAGEFTVAAPDRIELRPPAEAEPGSVVPLRVVADGAESAPRWIEVP